MVLDLGWIGVTSIVLYIPLVCFLDMRDRRVPFKYWLPLIFVNTPVVTLICFSGFPIVSLLVPLALCLIYISMMKLGYIHGADAWFLIFIALFVVYDPPNLQPGLFQVGFYFNLLGILLITAFYVFLHNMRAGNRYSLIKQFSEYPRGVPFMFPISIAFLLTLILDVVRMV